MAGQSGSQGSGRRDGWAFRLDAFGELVWQRTFGGSQEDRFRGIAATADEGFLLVGAIRSGEAQDADGWLIKLDEAGEQLWERRLRGPGDDALFNVAAAPDGGVVGVGHLKEVDGTGYDLWVLRVDRSGKLTREHRIDHQLFQAGTAVTPSSDGHVLVAGVTSDDAFRGDDDWILRIDDSGRVIWERRFGGPHVESARAMVPGREDTYTIIAPTQSRGAESTGLWLLEMEGHGRLVWERTYLPGRALGSTHVGIQGLRGRALRCRLYDQQRQWLRRLLGAEIGCGRTALTLFLRSRRCCSYGATA